MDLHYSVFVHLDLFEVVPKRESQRQRVMEFVRSLSNNPFTLGDFTDKDNALHTRQIKVVGDFAITYWVDDPVKTVMIVDIRSADK